MVGVGVVIKEDAKCYNGCEKSLLPTKKEEPVSFFFFSFRGWDDHDDKNNGMECLNDGAVEYMYISVNSLQQSMQNPQRLLSLLL